MALSKQPYKGARDFYPPDKRLQKYMFGVWRSVCESFGYEEYDAPILEPLDIYLAKSGEEIVSEQTYAFEDRGGRKVVIRPEMTPTVSRMVAGKRQELSYPLRWYSIPNLWRYERPQRGRLREHWQLNVDIFGVAGVEAEMELITLVDTVFKRFGAARDMYEIRLNSRKLIDYALHDYLKFTRQEAHDISKLIDRMSKMDRSKFIDQLDEIIADKSKADGSVEKLLSLLEVKEIINLPEVLQQHRSAEDLSIMLERLQTAGIENARFDITIMRGFDYYTDVVFEVFDMHPDNNRSMLAGGRYDGLVGLFGVEPVPTVGFGWGDVTLANFLELHHLLPKDKTETDLYVVLVGEVSTTEPFISELREAGLNIAVDLSGRKIGDQLKAADKKGIAFGLVAGAAEIKSKKFNLKNLDTGEEKTLDIPAIVKELRR
jgi:histidyl-tRNA synthetase